jgi:hypothetical protein
MKKTILLLLLIGSSSLFAQTLVYEESFLTPTPYTTGLLNGQNSWTAETAVTTTGGFNVVGTGLSYTGLASSVGAVEYVRPNTGGSSVNKYATRPVSSSTALAVLGGPDLWATALIRFDADIERAFIGLDFVRADGGAIRNEIGFGFSGGASFLGESATDILSGTTGGGPFTADTTHLALLRLQGGATDLMSLWINPDLSLGEAGLGGATITRTYSVFNAGINLSQVRLVASTNTLNLNSSAIFDEVRVGDSFSAVTIPEPGTLALVGVALGSLLIFRRRT